jgi:hypothetical protein
VFQAAVVALLGTALVLLGGGRPLTTVVGLVLGYLAASRLLATLRSELDATSRARLLLRPPLGRILRTHTVVPIAVTTGASMIAAIACAIAGSLPAHGAAAAGVAVGVTPILTFCAAMSARRGGRLPYRVLVTAAAADPSGGGLALLSWGTSWPTLGVVLAGVPILLVTSGGAGSPLPAIAGTLIAIAGLVHLVARQPVEP